MAQLAAAEADAAGALAIRDMDPAAQAASELAALRLLRVEMKLLLARTQLAEKSLYYLNNRQAMMSGLPRDWMPLLAAAEHDLAAAVSSGNYDDILTAKSTIGLIRRAVFRSKIKGTWLACLAWCF